MHESRVHQAARLLVEAEDAGVAQRRLTEDWPELDIERAYEIQDAALELRIARGERLIGVKLGLTSRAKQEQMGITSPLMAWVTDAMVLAAGTVLPLRALIHPRAEPEIVVRLGAKLAGPGIVAAEALDAVESVVGGIEVIDSRFENFDFKLPDVVADNASSALFALGTRTVDPRSIDLSLESCLLEFGGVVVDSATGAAVQGHPAEAVAHAANMLGLRGRSLEPGWLVLTGGMTDAIPLRAGTVCRARFRSLGTVSIRG